MRIMFLIPAFIIVFIVLVMWTQIVIPMIQDQPMFPIFRRKSTNAKHTKNPK